MNNILMRRALNESDKIVEIRDVVSGKNCNCVCIDCGARLLAKKGDIRTHHFSHFSGTENEIECSWKPETEIHIIAKEIITEDKSLNIPIGTFDSTEEKINFDTVEAEVRDGNLIPDITGYISGEALHIEIAVTHFCEPFKVTQLKQYNKSCLEINLSKFHISGDAISKDDLRNEINDCEKNWLSLASFGVIAEKVISHNQKQIQKTAQKYENNKKNNEIILDKQKRIINSNEKQISDAKDKLEQREKELDNIEQNLQQIISEQSNEQIEMYETDLKIKEKNIAKLKHEFEQKNQKIELIINNRAKILAQEKYNIIKKQHTKELQEFEYKKAMIKKEIKELKNRWSPFSHLISKLPID
jgi:hypothetical protein